MPPKKKNTSASKRSRPEAGDQIHAENRGERSALAAGRHALAAVFNIDIRDLKWQPVVLVMAIVGVLLGAILWFVIPKAPSTMTGHFNVAVAEFLVQDQDGRTIAGDDGSLLADYVAKQIKTQFTGMELDRTVPYEIWGPEQVDPIKGKTLEDRKNRAAELAEKIHAQILIYGVIVADGSQSKFMPEFYVNHRGFWQASEIAGPHEMGSQLNLVLPFDPSSILSIENPALAGRVRALDLITIGLAYYSVDDYQNAAQYFEQASAEPHWLESSGKEVAYLLAGNAYVGWASKDDDEQYLDEADMNYKKALEINGNYGRGLVGRANVLYLESLGSLQDVNVNPAKLDEAAALIERTLALQDQPASANLPTKAHFVLGQIALARDRAELPGGEWLEIAKQEFEFVTQKYEDGDTALEVYAAHSYFRLGLIAYRQNESDTSVDDSIALVKKAIALAPPFYKGEYSITLGNIYKNVGQKEKAVQAYKDALAFAEANGDAQRAKEYEKILKVYQKTLDAPNEP